MHRSDGNNAPSAPAAPWRHHDVDMVRCGVTRRRYSALRAEMLAKAVANRLRKQQRKKENRAQRIAPLIAYIEQNRAENIAPKTASKTRKPSSGAMSSRRGRLIRY